VKVVGMMVVGPGEGNRYLKEVLGQWKGLVDDAIICGNNTDKKTEKIISKSGYWFYRDDREWGIEQPNIKGDLLRKVAKLRPDWILPLDADELYDKRFNRETLEVLTKKPAIAYYFYIINLWGDKRHCKRSLNFENIRMFKHVPDLGYHFEKKPVHCGLAPPPFYHQGVQAPFMIKHLGLMKKESRDTKVLRYEKYDPEAKWKSSDYYNALKDDDIGSVFSEKDWHNKIINDVEQHGKIKFPELN
jgi:hypothetical protein